MYHESMTVLFGCSSLAQLKLNSSGPLLSLCLLPLASESFPPRTTALSFWRPMQNVLPCHVAFPMQLQFSLGSLDILDFRVHLAEMITGFLPC